MKQSVKTARSKAPARKRAAKEKRAKYDLRLYVAGNTQKSETAIANLQRICTQHFANEYRITVVDLLKDPALARGDQILAIPTLVRHLPSPMRKIIGDLSDTNRVLVGLDVKPRSES